MVIGYGVMTGISALLIVLYQTLIKKKEFWLGLLFVCVAVVNLGYFMLSLAGTIGFAIFANDVAYFGSVFLSMCMLFTIAKLCGFCIKKQTAIVLFSLAVIMFLIIATSGILPWYYTSVSIEKVNGATKLVREYGVLHPLYLVYLIAYFVAMIAVITYSSIKKMGATQKFAGALAVIVLLNLTVWFLEKFSDRQFEYLSVSYVVSEIMFVLLYWILDDYTVKCRLSAEQGVEITSLSQEEKLAKVLLSVNPEDPLGVREREILELILKNKKRKDIAEELHLSENTIKTYTRTLYAKLSVSSREELYALYIQN